jgi:hypothetical protein
MRVDAARFARRVLFPVVVSGLSALAVASHASRSRAPLRRCCATRRPAAPSASDTGEASEALAVASHRGCSCAYDARARVRSTKAQAANPVGALASGEAAERDVERRLPAVLVRHLNSDFPPGLQVGEHS